MKSGSFKMSKRRKPNETVIYKRTGDLLQIPEGKAYEYVYNLKDGKWELNSEGLAIPCTQQCGDPECKEWAKIKIQNLFTTPDIGRKEYREFTFHVSECELTDYPPNPVIYNDYDGRWGYSTTQ